MRIFVILMAVVVFFSLSAGTAMAKKSGSPFKELILKVMGLTKNTIQKEVNTVGTGIKKGADVVVEEVKDARGLAAGDGSKTKDILVKPVKGTAKVVGETTYGVINAPVEAAQEAAEEDIK